MAWDMLTIQGGVMQPVQAGGFWDILAVKGGVMQPYIPPPPTAVWDRIGFKKGTITPYVPPTPAQKWDRLAVKSGIMGPYVPPPPTGTATISVTSTPTGATVAINGAVVGKSPVSYKVQPGTYTVLVKLAGYKDFTTKVTVAANQTQTVDAKLIKITAEANWLPYVIGGGVLGVVILVAVTGKRKQRS
jgi:hypothetical protein